MSRVIRDLGVRHASDCRRFRLAFVAGGVIAVTGVAWGLPSRPVPEHFVARSMLAALPVEEQILREAAVETTLARMPGTGETFLSALMSWDYLTSGWQDPGLGGLPFPPAEISVYNNRRWGYSYAKPVTVPVGRSSFRASGLCFTSPLLLDLDGDSAPDVSGGDWNPHAGMDLNGLRALFDIDGDRFPDLVEWVGPSDGLLVAPENAESVGVGAAGDLIWTGPLSGRDLLGTAGGFADGFVKLAHVFDANHDGVISGTEFDGLFVWQDLDQSASIQPGELVHPQDLFITALHLPAAESRVGSFVDSSGQHAMWDWWPSYLQGYRVWAMGAPEPPTAVPLVDIPQPDLTYLGAPLPLGPDCWIDRASLQAAGLDFQTVRLVGLSPDGNWLVLQDRMPDLASVTAGLVRRLWILPVPGVTGSVMPRVVPVPAADILQFVFDDDGTAFLVTDNGGSILRLDLATGALVRVLAQGDGAAGLRLGGSAFRGPEGVCFSGWFHDADLASRYEAIVSYTEGTDTSVLAEAANRDLLLAGVEQLGDIAGEIPVGPNFSYFVVRTNSGESLLVVSRDGMVDAVDDNVLPNGLASSGDRVLYFRKTADQDEPEVRVFDALTSEIYVLGVGDYCYPYLTNGGTVACVASIDWQAMSLSLWRAPVAQGGQLQPALVASGIGVVRLSENGCGLAYLGPDGLFLGSLATTGVAPQEVRSPGLDQNRPNPFNPGTMFSFNLPQPGRAVLAIYDVRGTRVARLVDAALPAGGHRVEWAGMDDDGMPAPSGVYFARLETESGVRSVKVTLTK